MASFKTVKFSTDSDGPRRNVFINPDDVSTVEEDMVKPDQISHITTMTGQYFRVNEPAEKANSRLLNAI